MTIDDKNILWLDLFEFLSYKKKVKILSLYGMGVEIRKCITSKKDELLEIVSVEEYNKLSQYVSDVYFNDIISKYELNDIQILTLFNDDYPKLLKEIDAPPLCLYCKGDITLLKKNCVGIVGTRRPTEYGHIITKEYAKELSNAGLVIVSGLAMGVDSLAHEKALECGGGTIAVIAGGLEHIYPACNINLAKRIMENNLVISESKPSTVPASYLFPIRNRIISGLCKAVLITEASKNSGSLHTKNYCVEQGREIFAVPGRINSVESEGTNSIIKACQSAMTTSPSDILEFYGLDKKNNEKKPAIQLDINEQCIINYIVSEKKSFQQILEHTKLSSQELNSILFNMQMKGLCEKLLGNYYIAT